MLICTKIQIYLPRIFEISQNFAHLSFWVIWACLAMPTKINRIKLKENVMFICMQKINFILPFFFEILQRYHELAISGTSGIPSYNL